MRTVRKDEIKQILLEAGCSFKPGSRSFILSCPRCKKREKLYIRKTDGRFICFYCKEIDNFQGAAEFVLQELTSLRLNEIRQRLYGDEYEDLSSNDHIIFNPKDFLDDEDEEIASETILANIKFTPDILPIDSKYCELGREYLLGRGITLETALKYGIRFAPAQRRVVFPVMYENCLFGWQGRTISEQKEFWDDEFDKFVTINKSLTSKGLRKDQTLMFRDNLKNSKHCVLAEGPVDAIKADLCGGNVASMGKAVSFAQFNLIKNHGIKRIYLALDPDAAAEMRRILDLFKTSEIEIYDMRPKDGRDLGQMTFEEVKKLFDNAQKVDPSKIIVYIKNHYEEA